MALENLKPEKKEFKNKNQQDKRGATSLKEFAKLFEGIDLIDIGSFEITALRDLYNEFTRVIDPRVPEQVRYTLPEIILIVLLGVLSNCNEWIEKEAFARAKKDWLKNFLPLYYGTPSDTTLQRVLSMVDVQMVYEISINYFLRYTLMAQANARAQAAASEENEILRETNQDIDGLSAYLNAAEKVQNGKYKDITAIDGKFTISSRRKDTDQKPGQNALNTLNAFSVNTGSCLGQDFIPEKKMK